MTGNRKKNVGFTLVYLLQAAIVTFECVHIRLRKTLHVPKFTRLKKHRGWGYTGGIVGGGWLWGGKTTIKYYLSWLRCLHRFGLKAYRIILAQPLYNTVECSCETKFWKCRSIHPWRHIYNVQVDWRDFTWHPSVLCTTILLYWTCGGDVYSAHTLCLFRCKRRCVNTELSSRYSIRWKRRSFGYYLMVAVEVVLMLANDRQAQTPKGVYYSTVLAEHWRIGCLK